MKINYEAIILGITTFFVETGRIVLIATIPLILVSVETAMTKGVPIEIPWTLIQWTAILTALRALDRALHEVGKSLGNEDMKKGLTRF